MTHPALLDPSAATATAPDTFTVQLDTTQGAILVDVDRGWAPLGADRFYNLVTIGYYDDVAFFRVVDGFVAQVGIHGDPAVNKVWKKALIKDDPVVASNAEGTVTFATSGRDARTTQFFINYRNNARLDAMGFSAFGKVQDMDVARKLHAGYGEGAPSGRGPQQGRIHREGNVYLRGGFAQLDYIRTARVV
ncbi:MAG: peptidylprolyl isomerase [Deltaproteobacteria bacterium]